MRNLIKIRVNKYENPKIGCLSGSGDEQVAYLRFARQTLLSRFARRSLSRWQPSFSLPNDDFTAERFRASRRAGDSDEAAAARREISQISGTERVATHVT
jgi:hypothetical protein